MNKNNIKLKRPLVFFDLETTGLNLVKDKIIQFGSIKLYPDGKQEQLELLINPLMPIPHNAIEIHGITNDQVKYKPSFKEVAQQLLLWFKGCDIAGFNSDSYDIPLLMEEFARLGIAFPDENTNLIDVLKLERLLNSHTLAATYKRYTKENMEQAHNAIADVQATLEIFNQQINHKALEGLEVSAIDAKCQGGKGRVDYGGKLYKKDGILYWSFGKYKDHKLVNTEANYVNWVLNSDFPKNTKEEIRKGLKRTIQKPEIGGYNNSGK